MEPENWGQGWVWLEGQKMGWGGGWLYLWDNTWDSICSIERCEAVYGFIEFYHKPTAVFTSSDTHRWLHFLLITSDKQDAITGGYPTMQCSATTSNHLHIVSESVSLCIPSKLPFEIIFPRSKQYHINTYLAHGTIFIKAFTTSIQYKWKVCFVYSIFMTKKFLRTFVYIS